MHVVLASAFAGHVLFSPPVPEPDDVEQNAASVVALAPFGTSPASHVKHNPYALRYSDASHDSTHEPFHDVYPALHLHCVFTQPPIIRFPVGAFAVLQIELYVEFSGHNND